MKRALALFASAGAALVALMLFAQPAHPQGQGGPDGDITAVRTAAASGLQGGVERGVATLALKTCATNEVLKWNGSAWACAAASGGDVVQTVSTTGTITDLLVNSDTTVLKFTGGAAITLTGMTGGVDGRTIKIINATAGSNDITVSHNVTSTAANRFFLTTGPAGFNVTLFDNSNAYATYSSTDSRWLLSKDTAGGTGGRLALFLNGTSLGQSIIGESGGVATVNGALAVTGATNSVGNLTENSVRVFTVAGNGLTSTGGTVDAVCTTNSLTCNANSIELATRDFGDITTGSTGTTMTIDNSTVTSAKLNITTTSCSAGNHVSAISAGGVGTCTADTAGVTGSGTTNLVARWTSSSALGTGQIFDDNTNEVKVGSGADAATRTDAEFLVTLNGDTSLSVRNSTDDTEVVMIAAGSSVLIGSQTNTNVSFIAAGSAWMTYTGAGVSILDTTAITGSFSVSNNTTLGDATTDGTSIWGQVHYLGTAPSLSTANSCACTIASYSTNERGRVTCTDGVVGTGECALTFASPNYTTNPPACWVITERSTTVTGAVTIKSATTTVLTWFMTSAGTHGYAYGCDGML